jgi:hypothetical protein
MGQADRPLTLEFVRLGSHHSLSVLGPVAVPPNGEHRVPDSTTSLGARVGPASNIAGSFRASAFLTPAGTDQTVVLSDAFDG